MFGARPRSQVPAWASGAELPANALTDPAARVVPLRDVVEVRLPGSRWDELGPGNAAFHLVTSRRAQTVWSLPLRVQGTSLEELAAGERDAEWAELGRQVGVDGGPAVVRLIVPSDGDPRTAAAAFRRAATAIKRTPGVAIEWSVPPGASPDQVAAAWPGDGVVDIVGLSTRAGPSWAAEVAAPGGLADWRSWAQKKQKRLAVHWRLGSDPHRVRQVADWLDMAARTSTLAYDSVDARATDDARALAAYRTWWSRS